MDAGRTDEDGKMGICAVKEDGERGGRGGRAFLGAFDVGMRGVVCMREDERLDWGELRELVFFL